MTTRISGLASGIDTETMVKEMMTAARAPVDKLEQKKQYIEWQRDDYRSINTLLLEFDNHIFDGVGKQSSFVQKTITSSNSDAVSIKNLGSVSDFSGSIKVTQLASAATMLSDGAIGIADASAKLSAEGFVGEQTIKIQAIGKSGSLETYEYKFNPANETLESLISEINGNSGVTVFYDDKTKKMSVTAKNTGNAVNASGNDVAEIILDDGGSGLFSSKLKLSSDNITAASATSTAVPSTNLGTLGIDASFEYNGLTTTRPSNTFTINGVQLTLKQKTVTDTKNETVTFSSSPDVDAILETVTKFVDKYNEIVEKIRAELNEDKYGNYAPLTDAQKEEMTDDQIEKWEEKSKSGTLKNDSILKGLLNTMRTNLSSSVNGIGTLNQLAEIGITTTSSYTNGGKLQIDEDDLREAISADPNAVYKLFMADGSDTSQQGIARRLRDSLEKSMNNIAEKAGKASSVNNTFSLGKQLNNLEDRIEAWEDRLVSQENRYWDQFTAMEKAIQSANSQSSYIMQMLSSS